MSYAANARKLRAAVDAAVEYLTDEEALTVVGAFPLWSAHESYTAGDRVLRNDVLYKCLLDHASQPDWAPEVAPSLWAKVLTDADKVLPWEQPDSTNAYMTGDRVTHNGKTWVSDIDSNVWEPGVYGWTEVTE